MELKLTVVAVDKHENQIPGHTIVLHPKAAPQKHLGRETTDDSGRADFKISVGPNLKFLTARVFAPGKRKAIGIATQLIKELPNPWVVKLPLEWNDASSPTSPTVDDNRKPETESEIEIRPTRNSAQKLRARIGIANQVRKELRHATKEEFQRQMELRKRGKKLAQRIVGAHPKQSSLITSGFIPEAQKGALTDILEKKERNWPPRSRNSGQSNARHIFG